MKDHRRTHKGNIRHSIQEIFFLSVVGVVSGCDSWAMISTFGKLKLDWLRMFFPYAKGTPSQDTLERFFGKLSKEVFGQYFINWASQSFQFLENEVISIDGKRLRGSYDQFAEQGAIHVVSAYASANKLTLGQVATQEKSNEITAIPALLDLIEVKDTIVSIDAMGCQKEIARKIRDKGAHYLLAVKENQKDLYERIVQSFKMKSADDSHSWYDIGHGRVENRTCKTITALDWMEDTACAWKDLTTLICVQSRRVNKISGEEQSQTRYYISSKEGKAEDFNKYVRSHWAIENNLHWVLDVTFKEDLSRRRKGNSAYNLNIINKIALKILENHKGKDSKPITRMKAAVDDSFRSTIFSLS